MSSTQKDRMNVAFMSIRKNILSGDDARAFKTLTALIITVTKSQRRKIAK